MNRFFFFFTVLLLVRSSYSQVYDPEMPIPEPESQTPTYMNIAEPKHVLVVFKRDDPVSVVIKDYYVEKRNIPEINIVKEGGVAGLSFEGDNGIILANSGEVIKRDAPCSDYGGNRISLPMQKNPSDTTIWQASIPGVADSSLVDFFISAKDNENNVSSNPSDTVKSVYFYLVLNRPLTITDVQYSPFGSGFSGYNNYNVTLNGIVTADTSDIPGLGSTPLRIYMQDGSGAWSGIQIGAAGTLGNNVLNLKNGDKISVTGKIVESFAVTRIDSLTSLNVISSNNPLPAPAVVTTGTIAIKTNGTVDAEQWESVLIKYQNVTVTNYTADGTGNFGESYVDDGAGNTRVEWQEGGNTYHNAYDSTLIGSPGYFNVTTGSTFNSITGILYYSFSNYKLVPRKNDDMVGFVADAKEDESTPDDFVLYQNYPNPFNPSTTISFSLTRASHVSLKIFNSLGAVVATLIDNVWKESGIHNSPFSIVNSKFPSGVYFYQLKAGDFVATKKFVLLK